MKLWQERFVLGITGGMGSGKSTAAKYFEEFGAFRISADELARFYTSEKSPIKKELNEIFPESILDSLGNPDRKKISNFVFNDKILLKKLTDLIHPLVRKQAIDLLENRQGVVAWEIPLLFETGGEKYCDSVLTVWINHETAKKRVLERDHISESEFESRMQNQMSVKEKVEKSDFNIENSLGAIELKNHCRRIYETILSWKREK